MHLLITGFGLHTGAVPEENPLKITYLLTYSMEQSPSWEANQ